MPADVKQRIVPQPPFSSQSSRLDTIRDHFDNRLKVVLIVVGSIVAACEIGHIIDSCNESRLSYLGDVIKSTSCAVIAVNCNLRSIREIAALAETFAYLECHRENHR